MPRRAAPSCELVPGAPADLIVYATGYGSRHYSQFLSLQLKARMGCPVEPRVGRHLLATARRAFGLLAAMASKVRAAPLGCLRPCSHPCSVRTDTPRSAAN